ncbi:hypothetical protein BH09PAT4_BH09PAT4_03630 [soil metagenome]
MKPLVSKLQPTKGFSHAAYLGLVSILPLLLFVVLRINYLGLQLALAIVLLSKWRIFALRPRFWPAIVRANGVDIMVGVSAVLFMQLSIDQPIVQFLWAVMYALWLLFVKPGSSIFMVSAQAFIGQLAGLMALYLVWSDGPLFGLVGVTALICYLAARHFFDSFDEPYSRMLAYLWAYFAAGLVWVLGHWLLFYTIIAQPVIVLTTVGYGLAVLYYFDHHNKLTKVLQRQLLTIMLLIVLVLIIFSDWSDKIV